MKLREIEQQIREDISYDINGIFDNSMEEESKFITDIQTLIGNSEEKKDILINVIYHYINNFELEIEYNKGV